MEKLLCEILKVIYFEEHLRTAASELLYEMIVAKFVSGSCLKPS